MQRRRAVLVAPASDDRKARKALASIADEVVPDLEDAVTPANKDSARAAAADLVAEFGADRAISLRINAIDTPFEDWTHVFQVNFFAPIMLARGLRVPPLLRT